MAKITEKGFISKRIKILEHRGLAYMIGFMKREYVARSTVFLLAENIFKVDARK